MSGCLPIGCQFSVFIGGLAYNRLLYSLNSNYEGSDGVSFGLWCYPLHNGLEGLPLNSIVRSL